MDSKKEAETRFNAWSNSTPSCTLPELLEQAILDAYNVGVMDAVKVIKGKPYEANIALPEKRLVLESLFRLILGTNPEKIRGENA